VPVRCTFTSAQTLEPQSASDGTGREFLATTVMTT